MKNVFKAISLVLVISFLNVALGNDFERSQLNLSEKLSEFDQLVTIIKSSYGPLHYKEEKFGIYTDFLKARYTSKIALSKSNAEFYYLLSQFVAEYKDSHFAILVPTDHQADIPIYTDFVQNKVIITYLDKTKLPESLQTAEVGDEVVMYNNKPVIKEVHFIKKFYGQGYDLTAVRKATLALFHRSGKRVPIPAKDQTVKITVKKDGSNEVLTGEIKWEFKGSSLDEYDPASKVLSGEEDDDKIDRDHTVPYGMLKLDDELGGYFKTEDKGTYQNYLCNPSTRIAIPEGATMIMEKPIVAYYHPTEKGNVGYLRLPHYYPLNEQTGQFEYEMWFKKYEYAVSILEKNTVGLIIDQDHNCGGSVELLERMLGLFIRGPYKPMMFTLMASKESYFDFSDWQKENQENTLNYVYLERVRDLVKKHWLLGDFMTPMTSVWGADELYPHYVGYTKPIIVLIDEMSGSGGDAFPAMMQGNHRATLLGTRTMGAGGHVTEEGKLNYSRMEIHMTKSLFYHPDGTPIENNGATPDIRYSPTVNDVKNGFKDYQAFYLNELFKLL